jgi:uroporphyrinogen III methyltransferase / synthase
MTDTPSSGDMSPSGASGTGGARLFRVAVTRPLSLSPSPHPQTSDPLAALIREMGGEPRFYPLTRIIPPADARPLARGARGLLAGEFDRLLLTSARAVGPLVEALRGEDPLWRLPAGVEVWVVGEATGRAAEQAGLGPHRMPERFVAEGVLEALPSWGGVEGLSILFPRAAVGRERLPEGLAEAGARVTLVEAYAAELCPGEGDRLLADARAGGLEAVTLTAGSQAEVLAGALRRSGGSWPAEVPLVSVGPATSAVARQLGLTVCWEASPHTLDGVAALLGVLKRDG